MRLSTKLSMKLTITSLLQNLCMAALACTLLSSCATYRGTPQVVFDLGTTQSPQPTQTQQHPLQLPTIAVAEPNVPAWLDSIEMFYRLNYANDHQVRPYTNSRWSMPPIQLFAQRLKSSMAASGGKVLSSSESANNVPLVLHLEADDFTQAFDSADHSNGSITIRASVFDHRNLVAQKTFSAHAPSPSNDAAGGAKALSAASDQLINDILQWLSDSSLKK